MSPNKQLSVYLANGPINSYLEAIEFIESTQPLEGIKSFDFHIRGYAFDSDSVKPNRIELVRHLGAKPAIHVVNHGLYSIVSLSSSAKSSLIATLSLTDGLKDPNDCNDPNDFLICILSGCDVVAINTSISDKPSCNDKLGCLEESISIHGNNAFPWTRIKDALES